jgi:predicted RND superfamily exporter protein
MPLIIGIGVDNGVHMTNSFIVNGGNSDSISKSILNTGKALTFSMATTVLAFASGLFSNNPAFKEIGITLSIGIVSSYLAGMLLVPSIYNIIETSRSKNMRIKLKGDKIK